MADKKALTDRGIKALKPAPAGKRKDYMDAVVPHFGVRVTDRGSKSYILIARFTRGSSPRRRTIADVGAMNLADARQKARAWLELIGKGIDPAVAQERERRSEERRQMQTTDPVFDEFLA